MVHIKGQWYGLGAESLQKVHHLNATVRDPNVGPLTLAGCALGLGVEPSPEGIYLRLKGLPYHNFDVYLPTWSL